MKWRKRCGTSSPKILPWHNIEVSFTGYKYDAYRGRVELAFLDYNNHKDRKTRVNKYGTKILNRLYNRRSKTHFVVEVKEKKEYAYIEG